jgi:phytol kinase
MDWLRTWWQPDYTALAISYAYVFGVLGVAELLRRLRGRDSNYTRKFIHIGVGMWAIGTVSLFQNRTLALIPPLSFVLINAASYVFGLIRAMESGERGRLGTIYFPISFAGIIYLLWEQPVLLVAALMPMTWGDAQASIVGQRVGHHRYTVFGQTRTLEGSLAMLLWSWVATFLALWLMPLAVGQVTPNWLVALIQAAGTAVGCTVVEAFSPWGLDNLTVPAAAAFLLTRVAG